MDKLELLFIDRDLFEKNRYCTDKEEEEIQQILKGDDYNGMEQKIKRNMPNLPD